MNQTNWTQMLNRKNANTPLLGIFLCASTVKRVFSEFFKAQLRSSEGVFILFYWTFGSNLSASCCHIRATWFQRLSFCFLLHQWSKKILEDCINHRPILLSYGKIEQDTDWCLPYNPENMVKTSSHVLIHSGGTDANRLNNEHILLSTHPFVKGHALQ